MAATNGGAPLVVFDFDKTIVDCDSDNWVVDALGATDRFDELLRRLPWNHAIVSTHARSLSSFVLPDPVAEQSPTHHGRRTR